MMTFGSTMISMTTTRVILLNQSTIGRLFQRDLSGIAAMSNLMLLNALFRSTSTSLINNMIRWMGGEPQVKTDRWLKELELSRYTMLDYFAGTGGDC